MIDGRCDKVGWLVVKRLAEIYLSWAIICNYEFKSTIYQQPFHQQLQHQPPHHLVIDHRLKLFINKRENHLFCGFHLLIFVGITKVKTTLTTQC
jgi:hypothetical protein